MQINKNVRTRVEQLVAKNRSINVKIDQNTIWDLVCELDPIRKQVLPKEKDEIFEIVTNEGKGTNVEAPRWLCHLIGLKHASAHIALLFQTRESVNYILQVRSWEKSDSPGHLDITVGGHIKNNSTPIQTAWSEMQEEIGLGKDDLVEGNLKHAFGYSTFDSTGLWFNNNEWCEVYVGLIKPGSIKKLHFSDGEVVGLYLCPEAELDNLLKQKQIPVAAALRNYILQRHLKDRSA